MRARGPLRPSGGHWEGSRGRRRPDISSSLETSSPGRRCQSMLATARRDDRNPTLPRDEAAVEVAVGEVAGDDVPFMSERTPTTPASKVGDAATEAPRLRLAGTNAGPVTDEERRLLELRVQVVRARGAHGTEAGVIRDRLGRTGRRDPMATVRGDDVFDRTAAELDSMLASIDARLAQLDAGRPRVEIDPAAAELLRRR